MLNRAALVVGLLSICGLLSVCTSWQAFAADAAAPPEKPSSPRRMGVYGEWRIHVRPDKGSEYERLIATKGLPLFRKAGGRMVGWWKTLIGNVYEHVTIWEFDDMAAYERAGEILGPDKQFAQFAAERDPLLVGENSRFLTLTDSAVAPALDEQAKFVVHEVHRVLPKDLDAYLRFMHRHGLDLLKHHGFDPVGPWIVNVGSQSEVTYLFRYKSLRERDELLAAVADDTDMFKYRETLAVYAEEVTTRLLVPAPFAVRSADAKP